MTYDVAIVGAGAAGLQAAIFAGREGASVVALEGAARIGAKILISGGGRCNVTHYAVAADDFNGSRNAIAKVLRTFTVPETIEFFAELGVDLKREETGKLFPESDRAATVVDALLSAARDAGVEIRTGMRVLKIRREDHEFVLATPKGDLRAKAIVLATGGKSVPKTGSDGGGYDIAHDFGHTITETWPALVPLLLPSGHWLTAMSGTSVDGELAVRAASGRVLTRVRGSMLFTHFGLSGPAVLDVSRHLIAARRDGRATLVANLLPEETAESFDAAILAESRRNPRATLASFLRGRFTERMAAAIGAETLGMDGATRTLVSLTRDERRAFVRNVIELELPVQRDRGFDYAEVTAGGVPLDEIELSTMRSRRDPGLFLCGEILDVDGRIGGFNFQWAWATGRLAGIHAARAAGEVK
jgi:predicted Rossmann fold flavoprotein